MPACALLCEASTTALVRARPECIVDLVGIREYDQALVLFTVLLSFTSRESPRVVKTVQLLQVLSRAQATRLPETGIPASPQAALQWQVLCWPSGPPVGL